MRAQRPRAKAKRPVFASTYPVPKGDYVTAPDFFRKRNLLTLGAEEIVYPTCRALALDIATGGIFLATKGYLLNRRDKLPPSLAGRAAVMQVVSLAPRPGSTESTSPFIADLRRVSPNRIYEAHITDLTTADDAYDWYEENEHEGYVRIAAAIFRNPDGRPQPVGDERLFDDLKFLKASVDAYARQLHNSIK